MKIGIRKSPKPNKRAAWIVWYYINRKRKQRSFETREEAEAHIRDIRTARKNGTTIEQIRSALNIVAGTDYNLKEIVRVGLDAMRQQVATGSSVAMTFAEATKLVLKNAVKRGCRKHTIASYKGAFAVLNRTFGDRIASCIRDTEVWEYLNIIPNVKGIQGAATASTKATVLRIIRMVLRVSGVTRPLSGIILPFQEANEIDFFSIAEVKKIMAAAYAHERGMLALALFAGLRPQRLGELPSEYIKIPERNIRIPGPISKNRFSILLETNSLNNITKPGPPPVVWEWLRQYPYQPQVWARIQQRLKRRVGCRWIHDGCRHTAATYFCAIYGVIATAELLGHNNTSQVKRHYAGLATRSQAEEFFSITPDTIPAPPLPPPPPANQQKKIGIPPEEMIKLAQEMTLEAIAAKVGCSSSAITKYCRRHDIPTPGRGGHNVRAL